MVNSSVCFKMTLPVSALLSLDINMIKFIICEVGYSGSDCASSAPLTHSPLCMGTNSISAPSIPSCRGTWACTMHVSLRLRSSNTLLQHLVWYSSRCESENLRYDVFALGTISRLIAPSEESCTICPASRTPGLSPTDPGVFVIPCFCDPLDCFSFPTAAPAPAKRLHCYKGARVPSSLLVLSILTFWPSWQSWTSFTMYYSVTQWHTALSPRQTL